MMVQSGPENVDCPRDEIASYIDGELSPSEETDFDKHLAECGDCRTELKHQKAFLFALNASLESEDDIPLPKNFTRTIVANAESRVTGLRRPRERFTAIFICAALFFFALFALGGEAEIVWTAIGSVAEKVVAVGSFVTRLAFNVSYSVAVVARSLFSHVNVSWMIATTLILLSGVALVFFSRSFIRGSRTQEN